MDATELRRWCLQHAGAIEDFPFGPEHSVFKVAGKMFALSALDRVPLEVSVKCEPELAAELRHNYLSIRPGYHLNKRHWNRITLDRSLPDQVVRDLIEDSYDWSSRLLRLLLPELPRQQDQPGQRPVVLVGLGLRKRGIGAGEPAARGCGSISRARRCSTVSRRAIRAH
jgi:predicted DNA-binding protein (MmcQ/YjbR family)